MKKKYAIPVIVLLLSFLLFVSLPAFAIPAPSVTVSPQTTGSLIISSAFAAPEGFNPRKVFTFVVRDSSGQVVASPTITGQGSGHSDRTDHWRNLYGNGGIPLRKGLWVQNRSERRCGQKWRIDPHRRFAAKGGLPDTVYQREACQRTQDRGRRYPARSLCSCRCRGRRQHHPLDHRQAQRVYGPVSGVSCVLLIAG